MHLSSIKQRYLCHSDFIKSFTEVENDEVRLFAFVVYACG